MAVATAIGASAALSSIGLTGGTFGPTPSPVLTPTEVISLELGSLRHADYFTGFRFASQDFLQSVGGNFTGYTDTIDSHYGIMRLHAAFASHTVTSNQSHATVQTQLVGLRGEADTIRFDLRNQTHDPYQGCWMIDGISRVYGERSVEPDPSIGPSELASLELVYLKSHDFDNAANLLDPSESRDQYKDMVGAYSELSDFVVVKSVDEQMTAVMADNRTHVWVNTTVMLSNGSDMYFVWHIAQQPKNDSSCPGCWHVSDVMGRVIVHPPLAVRQSDDASKDTYGQAEDESGQSPAYLLFKHHPFLQFAAVCCAGAILYSIMRVTLCALSKLVLWHDTTTHQRSKRSAERQRLMGNDSTNIMLADTNDNHA
eukprot:comp17390_c0_seq1/m.16716 comp17390_c0_seq1/g.16716  ORF comp17390_c0_seq1/g.16716 comp17390_c0_seq1/m.16716 type:complete len:370 (-) comp17390_c0_seq1:191-1300(-)